MTNLLLRLFLKGADDDPHTHTACGKLAGAVGLLCNLLLFAMKLAAGLLSGSLAVTADAVNSLSDAASSIVTLLGFRLAAKPADREHPFGHARAEYLSGLAIAALILLIGAELARNSVLKILHPAPVTFSLLTLLILAGSGLLKLWLSGFFRTLGRRIDSEALLASAVDSRNDTLATAAVLLGCLLSRFFGWRIDGWLGLFVAVFILLSGIGVAKDTVSPLLGKPADSRLVLRLTELLLSNEKVLGFHDLMLHDYGPGQCFASVHAEMDAGNSVLVCHDILDGIEREAYRRLHVHLVIHCDPVNKDNAEQNRLRLLTEIELRAISPALTLHDFRLSRTGSRPILTFDLAVPFSLSARKEEIRRRITHRLLQEDPEYEIAITFDDT